MSVTASSSPKTSWIPTRKWLASLAAALASIVASWIVTGAFDDVERGMAATALVSLVAAYFKSNDATPGGVPVKRGRSSWSTKRKKS